MESEGIEFALLGVSIKPLYDGEFHGRACMIGLYDNEPETCALVTDGLLAGKEVSFKVGGIWFEGERVGEDLDMSFTYSGGYGNAFLELQPPVE